LIDDDDDDDDFTNHSLTFYSFAVHALVVSVIVYYLSHAKNYD